MYFFLVFRLKIIKAVYILCRNELTFVTIQKIRLEYLSYFGETKKFEIKFLMVD